MKKQNKNHFNFEHTRDKFSLEITNDKPILTCCCGKRYEITKELIVEKSKFLFDCPHCNLHWHYERDLGENTILLILPRTNDTIALRKIGQRWDIDEEYYKK